MLKATEGIQTQNKTYMQKQLVSSQRYILLHLSYVKIAAKVDVVSVADPTES